MYIKRENECIFIIVQRFGEDKRYLNVNTFADIKREVRQDDPNDN